ncbi:MAG: LysM peptidoglycan-binding domain-containing protein [Chloroflexi bacterium]|nr:LysM peptidoglycan-binding domain-containing protein [Chloroflexota bacterium]
MCGTSTAAIYAANPGIGNVLTVGQALVIPGIDYVAPAPPTPAPITVVPVTVNNYNYYNYYNYYPPTSYTSTYIVQYGDTLSIIAGRFGVGLYDLWRANPQIRNINLIYVGQVIYIPSAAAPKEPVPLSYPGDIPKNASTGTVLLVNKANADVYISARTARADGTNAINEFPVSGTLSVGIPSGWIDYVAWVGGVKFTGGFQLRAETQHTITFNRSKVVVD